MVRELAFCPSGARVPPEAWVNGQWSLVSRLSNSELVMGCVHPWVGLGQSFFNFWWVGWRLDCVIFLTS